MSSSSGSRSAGLILAGPIAAIVGLIALVLAVAALGGSGTAGCGGSETVGALSSEVPSKLVPLYENAAAKYHLGVRGPSVLAAINFVETSFGTDVATSSAGAEGWMAFLPSTFAEWGVDGNGDGVKDIFNSADAIFSAAKLPPRLRRARRLAEGGLRLQPCRLVCRKSPALRDPVRRRRRERHHHRRGADDL